MIESPKQDMVNPSIVTAGDVAGIMETFAPLALQEGYDNCGLQVGSQLDVVTGILVCLDVTDEVIDEAIALDCNMIVSHHPLIFGGLKRLNGHTAVERMVIKAIRHGIALYAAHTNADAVGNGVSGRMAMKLGLEKCRVLSPLSGRLMKLITFVPVDHLSQVRDAIFEAGAGHIGHYDSCSFQVHGHGTFRGDAQSQPYVGCPGTLHTEPEVRIETVMPDYLSSRVVDALFSAHPYEEVAYDLYPLANQWSERGFGIIGQLSRPEAPLEFLNRVKAVFGCQSVRYSPLTTGDFSRVALCGGSGSDLIKAAMAAKADVFITGDIKYHQFFEADGRMVIADIGHFESEQFTKELFFELLTEKLPNFAIHLSNINSNPINYL
ncbi:dinuclear metal center YbgI/SA1388 family protein [Breznakibacter xylanolyticus]|uniref:GTP cyclohydrolase 1 type 2 homolog n=1 Tax=Breznakibacter xylanolyticus TaxID=990 RepID=A0A2W7NMC0_9BACT|nr:Nif3-like dinuclear metal center hexameric protein [Breznakibacter xylanolyticus]PZX20723.1 dinuclear metal center YbgI/SA1388 family protein [Breznakibacter xylanolyticus]